jgi:transposase
MIDYRTRDEMERRRLLGAELLRAGVSQAEAARQAGVTRTAASRWAAALAAGADLRKRRGTGRRRKIDRRKLRKLWQSGAYRTFGDFASAIRDKFGVAYAPDHVGRIVHDLGLLPVRPRRMKGGGA